MAKRLMIILTVSCLLLSAVSLGLSGAAVYETGTLYGDIDNDGAVTSSDALVALDAASGKKPITDSDKIKKADINSDGQITLYDARQILRSAIGVVSLQPSGAFTGVENNNGVKVTKAAAVQVYNELLNKIKTTENGYAVSFVKTEKNTFSDATASGELSGPVLAMIKSIAASEDSEEDGEPQNISKGDLDYSLVTIENTPFVSRLEEGDVFGLKSYYQQKETGNYITIVVAIPDCDLESISQSAYSRILNSELLIEDTDTIFSKLLLTNSVDTDMRRVFKDGILTLTYDANTGEVQNYKIEYTTEMFIAAVGIDLPIFGTVTVNDMRFTKTHSIEYTDFQWDSLEE